MPSPAAAGTVYSIIRKPFLLTIPSNQTVRGLAFRKTHSVLSPVQMWEATLSGKIRWAPLMRSTAHSGTIHVYHTAENNAASRELMRRYITLFTHCSSVFDIGCGPGYFLELLREQNPKRQFFGIDVDPEMVQRVQSKGFDARCMDVRTIAGGISGTFDGMYAGHIIEHLCGDAALDFLKTCFALLNPGGVLLLKTPNWDVPYVRHEGFWLDISHVRPYPAQLLDKVLSDIGFVNIRTFAEPDGLHDVVAIGVKVLK